ncbi:MAG: orotidine-5'-phosphate decarboxylase [Actinobacteria bacterium]|nr:orotidine-5'-phosphate decarboxylase [Actinomycetota bacterium]MCL5887267.1 orotidine-5'-phosphate decarboxylase [Actinomycetota bacterium]
MRSTQDSLIVALDTDAMEALRLAEAIRPKARWVKVGMTLYYAEGPAIVDALHALGYEVFLDLKLYDIPHQVEGAAYQIARTGVRMFTVHASGGAEMMRAAVRGAAKGAAEAGHSPPDVLAVSVLTSFSEEALAQTGITRGSGQQVELLVELAKSAGVQGIVCSPLEAAQARAILGPEALVVTPGVRPSGGSESDDQVRVATPSRALESGASHVVVGRPITMAEDPLAAIDGLFTD